MDEKLQIDKWYTFATLSMKYISWRFLVRDDEIDKFWENRDSRVYKVIGNHHIEINVNQIYLPLDNTTVFALDDGMVTVLGDGNRSVKTLINLIISIDLIKTKDELIPQYVLDFFNYIDENKGIKESGTDCNPKSEIPLWFDDYLILAVKREKQNNKKLVD